MAGDHRTLMKNTSTFFEGCKKLGYLTRSDARKAKKRLTEQHRKIFTEYQCTRCNWWHLTTMDRDKRRRFIKK